MASSLPKLLTRPSLTRFLSPFQLPNPHAHTIFQPLLHSPPSPFIGTHPQFPKPQILSAENEQPHLPTVFFPSFPFGFPVKTVSFNVDVEMDDGERTMWADSVKKKRKKKMNKHKYQKLRKRMRRQS